jgi:hypothetical protein
MASCAGFLCNHAVTFAHPFVTCAGPLFKLLCSASARLACITTRKVLR